MLNKQHYGQVSHEIEASIREALDAPAEWVVSDSLSTLRFAG
jgi:hypothetical protein